MKKIANPFDWYPRDFWYWPEHDEKLLQVIDWVHDLDQVLPLIPNKRVCIQAGGATGVWPAYLSLFFGSVITFEPNYENFRCLKKNTLGVDVNYGALGEIYEPISQRIDNSEKRNAGAVYFLPSDEYDGHHIHAEPIDDYVVEEHADDNVDFICLDIEGYEEKALRGAAKTIERCNPVIMIEEKPLPHMKKGEHLKARQYLESIGYKEVLKVHRDVVFKR